MDQWTMSEWFYEEMERICVRVIEDWLTENPRGVEVRHVHKAHVTVCTSPSDTLPVQSHGGFPVRSILTMTIAPAATPYKARSVAS